MPTGQKGQETRVLPLVKDEQSSCSACHDYDSSQGITKQIYEHVGTNSDRKEQVCDLISTLFTMQTGLMKQPWLIRKLQIGLIELTLTRRCKRAVKIFNDCLNLLGREGN